MLKTVVIDNNFSDLEKVNSLGKEAFPPEEYISSEKMLKMSAADKSLLYLALYDDNRFVGFTVIKVHKDIAYLFFLAICSECRGLGYGSQAIATLKALYPDYCKVVDFEMIDDNAPNNEQRIKRKNFYLRNGFNETGLFLTYLGVDFEVMSMDGIFAPETFKEMLSLFKANGFNPKYFEKKL